MAWQRSGVRAPSAPLSRNQPLLVEPGVIRDLGQQRAGFCEPIARQILGEAGEVDREEDERHGHSSSRRARSKEAKRRLEEELAVKSANAACEDYRA